MNFEDIIEGQFYQITTAVSVVFYDDSGREVLVRFEEGTEVQVQAKFSTKYGKYRAVSPWDGCVCEFVSEGLDDEGSALIGAHILEPLHGGMLYE